MSKFYAEQVSMPWAPMPKCKKNKPAPVAPRKPLTQADLAILPPESGPFPCGGEADNFWFRMTACGAEVFYPPVV